MSDDRAFRRLLRECRVRRAWADAFELEHPDDRLFAFGPSKRTRRACVPLGALLACAYCLAVDDDQVLEHLASCPLCYRELRGAQSVDIDMAALAVYLSTGVGDPHALISASRERRHGRRSPASAKVRPSARRLHSL